MQVRKVANRSRERLAYLEDLYRRKQLKGRKDWNNWKGFYISLRNCILQLPIQSQVLGHNTLRYRSGHFKMEIRLCCSFAQTFVIVSHCTKKVSSLMWLVKTLNDIWPYGDSSFLQFTFLFPYYYRESFSSLNVSHSSPS